MSSKKQEYFQQKKLKQQIKARNNNQEFRPECPVIRKNESNRIITDNMWPMALIMGMAMRKRWGRPK